MKVLFVYPKYPDTFWSFKHVLKFVSKKAAFPPLGLLTVAAMVPEEWEKRVVDVNVKDITSEDIAWADLVFMSAMIVQKESAKEIIAMCNEQKTKIVAGGPLFTTHQEQFENVDHFVLNEAEITLPKFLEDLEQGKAKHVYTSTERPDVTKTPLPMWELINLKDYSTMAVQYSRGCPFNCEFCDIIVMNGRFPRTKTTPQLLEELQSLYDVGWRGSIFIVDDNFIGNIFNVKKMLQGLIEWQKEHKYPFTLLTEASTNLGDDEELLRLMSAANFNKVFLGIETPSDEGLKECGKFQNVARDLKAVVKRINQHGMQVMAGFIVGFDSDTDSVFETQIKFVQEIGVVTALVSMLNALPQTRLWYRLKDEGRLVQDTTGGDTDATVNFIPKMDKDKLIEGYKDIVSTIYTPRMYYRRINTFIKNYKPTAKSHISWNETKAFMKICWVLGVVSRARFRFWWLVTRTLTTKAKALPIAVELAIYGLHFEKVARRIAPVQA